MLKKILQAVSLIFEPFSVGFLTIIVVIDSATLSLNQKLNWIFISTLVAGVPPLAVLIYEKKIGKISDWFIYKREERRDVEIAWIFGSLLLTLVCYFFKAPLLLFGLALDLFFLSLIFTIINFYWKISVHAALVSLFVLSLILFKSVVFLPSVLLIPLVGYSRWYLHKHTLTQLTVGSIVTLLVSYTVFIYLGLISI